MPRAVRSPGGSTGTAGTGRSPALGGLGAVAVLLPLLALSAVLAIGLGSAVVAPADTLRYLWAALSGGEIGADEVTRYQIIWQLRTPRVLLAAIVGAGLGAVGVAIQAMVRNPLADPFILGVSSGASVGAVAVGAFGILTALGVYAVSAGAFLGALGATALVYLISSAGGGVTPLRLVLTGVALSFGFQAVMGVIVYFAPNSEATSTVLFWTMGGFGAATWGSLPPVAAVVLAGTLVLRAVSRPLDVLTLGDETAASLGVGTDRLRKGLFALTALMTGAMVAVSGAIGFVGLVVPHVVRIVVGAGHRRVLTVAPLAGAVFMVWADLASRVLVAPRELPLGFITALVGVPVFIALLRRRGYLFGGR
ncbi:iron complex transport system permease protein [Spinactinospora alkalitolerans]|uniref:Iron complex transport system permease protein n=1 Tax=Spinactinospora alkalitolerans TaxID=687207 RepID=A0A852TW56_9ACTN|nr:iron ABC transporter permease [Spinactinospora alkalitolerans]NYE47092.1 iron complex transport system permease protein [Spinactinospora alkalitolerans]